VTVILSVASVVVLLTILVLAILFTSGLDVGLIMFPLVDFKVYATDRAYAFANPLAIEFGFWGFLVWTFYFLTTFYFCIVEPKLKLFEIPAVKYANNLVVITTCAFTAYLLLIYLPSYIPGINELERFGLVAVVILLAAMTSTEIRYVKALSVASIWLFLALIVLIWLASGMGASGLAQSMAEIGSYFRNIHRFVTPITDYHDRSICCTLCRRPDDAAIARGLAGHTLDPDRHLVFGLVFLFQP
jgi:glycine betaine transporter